MPRRTRRLPNALTAERIAFLDQLLPTFEAQDRLGAAIGEAARWGYDAYIESKLNSGIPTDLSTENGGTPLMFAASGGQLSTMRLLIQRGANVNARDVERGMTPLMWCLASMHLAEVYVAGCRLLLDHGADPTPVAIDGKDAFWWANDRDNADELCTLLRQGGRGNSGGA